MFPISKRCTLRAAIRAVSYTHLDVYKRQVPGKVERELFVDAALPGDVFQAVVDRIECRHGKNTSVAGQTPVLVQDEQRIRQKFDNVSGFGLTGDGRVFAMSTLCLLYTSRCV